VLRKPTPPQFGAEISQSCFPESQFLFYFFPDSHDLKHLIPFIFLIRARSFKRKARKDKRALFTRKKEFIILIPEAGKKGCADDIRVCEERGSEVL
jgi:hypothetical protein